MSKKKKQNQKYLAYEIKWALDGNLDWDSDVTDIDAFNEQCRRKLVPEYEVEFDEDDTIELGNMEKAVENGKSKRSELYDWIAERICSILEDKYEWTVENFSYRPI